MSNRLLDKRIMITGAAQGIGLAIAKAFAREGASLFLIDRDEALLQEETAKLKDEGYRVSVRSADITDAKAIVAAVSAAETEIGRINALVNNAGVNVFSEPLETSDEEWNRCFDINLKGAWNCCKAVLPGLIEQGGGVILNIASTHAFTIIPHTFPYPLAKHALLGMTKSLGLEGAPVTAVLNLYSAENRANASTPLLTPDPSMIPASAACLKASTIVCFGICASVLVLVGRPARTRA